MFEKIKTILTGQKAIDIYKRAAKTFLQAFLGTIVYDLSGETPDLSMLKPILLGAISAGICAVMNLILVNVKNDYY